MKKVFFLLAILFATVYSFAQNNPNVSQEKVMPNDTYATGVPQTFCSVPPVVVNVTQNNNSFTAIPQVNQNGFLVNKKIMPRIIYRDRGSVTFITNHNYFGDTTKSILRERSNEVCCGAYGNHGHFIGWGLPTWFWLLLALVGIILLIAYLVDRHRRNHPIVQGSTAPPVSPVTIKNYHPVGSKAESTAYKTPVKPAVDLTDAVGELKGTGATITVYADGGVKVQFPKEEQPEGKKEEPAQPGSETKS